MLSVVRHYVEDTESRLAQSQLAQDLVHVKGFKFIDRSQEVIDCIGAGTTGRTRASSRCTDCSTGVVAEKEARTAAD